MASCPKHFDTLGFVKRSKELGVSEQVAEYQARQIEQAIDIAIVSSREKLQSKDLATKKDVKELELKLEIKIKKIETKIEQSKTQIIIWMLGFFVAIGLITHFFK